MPLKEMTRRLHRAYIILTALTILLAGLAFAFTLKVNNDTQQRVCEVLAANVAASKFDSPIPASEFYLRRHEAHDILLFSGLKHALGCHQ